jgi:hypothetical protein
MVLVHDARAHAPDGHAGSDETTDEGTPALEADARGQLPRSVAALLHTCAALVWLGMFALYVRVWLAPQESDGVLVNSATAVVNGTADAPFQYRILVPHVLLWLHDHLGWPIGYAETVLDLAMLGIGIAVTAAILRRLHLEVWVLAVACFGAYLGVGMLWFGKFETITAFAAMTVATWAILCDDRRRWLPMAAVALVLAGTRTDLLLAIGVALVARWLLAGRHRRDLVGGLAIGAFGVAATIGLILRYPDARYDEQVGAVQIVHNLQPLVLLVFVAFALPAVGPYLLARSQPPIRSVVNDHRAVMVPLLALVAAELVSILVIGRADEVRLLFPLATPLAIVGVVGWRAILAPSVMARQGMGEQPRGL